MAVGPLRKTVQVLGVEGKGYGYCLLEICGLGLGHFFGGEDELIGVEELVVVFGAPEA